MSLSLLAPLLALQLSAAAPATPCSSAEYRQFDFWVGQWQVVTAKGVAGRNRIERVHGGCALAEHWHSASGNSGSSLNAFDPADGRWRQFWVDQSGTVLQLEGRWNGTAMVLQSAPGPVPGGQLQRITWTPAADGTVRQHWQQSDDAGATWSTAFDGVYRKSSGQ